MATKKIAVVGFGFMGRMHYGCWKKTRGAKVVAVCDSNLAAFKSGVKGNIAGADNSELPSTIAVFADFDEMLKQSGADVVDITLPTPLHPAMVVKALEAGKDVLCEKPMALDPKACDAMLAAAKRSGRKLMVAQCLRFWPEYMALRQMVTSGRYGKVVAADFTRFSARPGWNSKGKSWFMDESKSGGVALDMNIHDADMVNYLFGLPKALVSRSHELANGFTDHIVTLYEYPNMVVTSQASWAVTGVFGFEAGFKVVFERATVVLDAKRAGGAFTVYTDKGEVLHPKLASGTGYENEIKWFVSWLNGKNRDQPLTAQDARNSIALVTAERKSARTGRRVCL